MVIRQLPANNARFGSIAIPFQGDNPLTKVTMLVDTPTASIFKLDSREGNALVCQSEKAAPLDTPRSGISFEGFLGVVCASRTRPREYVLYGAYLEDAEGRLSCDKPVPVLLSLEPSGPAFTNLGSEPVQVTWHPKNGSSVTLSVAPEPQP
jgi:hypothetical protein